MITAYGSCPKAKEIYSNQREVREHAYMCILHAAHFHLYVCVCTRKIVERLRFD
jgi:hypothetical protein